MEYALIKNIIFMFIYLISHSSKIIYNLPQKEYKKEELAQSKFKFREV